MPKKGTRSPRKNNQLHFTLPSGARYLLDQLVELEVVGDGYSGVIAFLVETQLQAMRRDYGLKLPPNDAANNPSIGAKPGEQEPRS
jgi:hypothetical protein